MEEPRVPFPPAPWHLDGHAWIGLFRTDRPVCLPAGLRSLFGSRWLILILARYLTGTLRYDELIVGAPVRRGLRIGVWAAGIWVNDEVSRQAGRCIWGLPKELAEFQWHGGGVRVCDKRGMIAAFELDQGRHARCPIWTPAVGVGQLDGHLAWTTARVRACLGRARLGVGEWSERFPFRLRQRPVLSAAAWPFRMTVPAPRVTHDQ